MFASACKNAVYNVARVGAAKRISAVPRSFATYKSSTGLVGLEVDPNGRETLQELCADVLSSVKKIPEDSGYRKNVEQWFSYITKVTNEHENVMDIEREIDLGQIEEVIEMAKDELELIDYYYEEKGWERIAAARKEADLMVAELADTIYFSDPSNRRKPA